MPVAPRSSVLLPEYLDRTMRGFMPSRCLLTALELDLFSSVGQGATRAAVTKHIQADERATGMLLNALVALGLLSKHGDTFKNTPDTQRFFTRDSRDNQREGLLHIANIWHRWGTLTDAIRGGTCVRTDRAEKSTWTKDFIAAMDRNATGRARSLVKALGTKGIRRILDLGGGSGAYSIAFARASRQIRCDILDVSEVVPLTAEYLRRAGVSDRVSVRAGDMLRDEFGSRYDLIMLNAICHMFGQRENRELFQRARRALAPNGRLSVQDFILDPDKTGPPHAALFALNMLVATKHGATYTEAEYSEWMRSAGFANTTRIRMPGPADLIVGSAERASRAARRPL